MTLISIGHATLDLFLNLENAHLHKVDLDKQELCLPFPDKVQVDHIDISPGGNALNVVTGLTTLGLDGALYTHRTEGVLGAVLSEHYEKHGISRVSDMTREECSLSVVLSFQQDRVILSHPASTEWSWTPPNLSFSWAYLTSLGTRSFRTFHRHLKEYLKDHQDITCAYNPGSRELNHPARELDILEVVDVLIVNRDEAGELLEETDPSSDEATIRDLANRLRSFGPDIVLITNGRNGSWGMNASGLYFQPVFPTEVVESTGAGDAFSTGAIAALKTDHSLSEALTWGTALSHSVLSATGATEGLLTRKELQDLLSKHQK